MTRKRRRGHPRSQMPTDPTRAEQIVALDAAKKAPPVWQDDFMQRIELARAARTARQEHDRRTADVITQGHKQPRTWDEINSVTGAGGISSLYPP